MAFKPLPLELPAALLSRLDQLPGFDRAAFIEAHHMPAPVSVRLHPLKQPVPGPDWTPSGQVPWCPSGVYLAQRPLFTADPLFHAGAYYVQEASSMFLDHVLGTICPERNGLRVLDLCAAPGGKSTLLAGLLGPDSLLVSNEVIRQRATILEENMNRWGYRNTWVSSNDPRDFGRIGGYFDVVLTDVPCSGSGLFRKDPAALEEWSPDNVRLCSERQQRILEDVWPALKEGGYLIYATCSYSPEEDEELLDLLAGRHAVSSIRLPFAPGWGITETSSEQHGLYGYRFFPDKTMGEGFFIAVLQKQEAAPSFYYPPLRSAHQKKIAESCRHLLRPDPFVVLENDRKSFIAVDAALEPDYHLLSAHVYLRRAGTGLGQPAQKEWIPEHDVALAVEAAAGLPAIEVDRAQAIAFLKKETIMLPPGLAKGWYILRYRGLGLGWIKALGNRVNNYLPKHWRIRMDIAAADR